MSANKHTNDVRDLSRAYEENDVKLKGIVWFGGGLLALIVITFILMWLFLAQLEQTWADGAGQANPMLMTDRERLPPEPRLQGAPGFGVESPKGRVVMELTAPQSEWWELERQWADLINNGQTHPTTGDVIAMPIEEAKAKLLQQGVKAKTGPEAEEYFKRSQMFISEPSAGRMYSDTRR
jgi:hypothetical protein